ncbi:T9SS type A sorting domain-containing protein [Pseudotamlana carrageenivorans]|uniref:T9SS type A sorting domain-containing protein n=1 Tax=Pseudotamlana carrageenivorans TaxID=2069432 RepID=UPI001315AD53|nr:T9SS type A sorting domain-containing protein [Tamlana carrageenivorans]
MLVCTRRSYGETLKLRVYPWYSGEATGKTICLADVNIHGVATPLSLSIDDLDSNKIQWVLKDDLINIKNLPINSLVTIYDLTGRVMHKSQNVSSTLMVKAPNTTGIYIGRIESKLGVKSIKFFVP